MNPETKQKKKGVGITLLITLGIMALISTSELLYNFKNNDNFRMQSYLYLTRLFAKSRNLNISLKYLGKAAEIGFAETFKKYPEIEFEELAIPRSLPETQNLQNQYLDLLTQTDHKLLSSTDSKHIGKLFYQLGLISFKNNEADKLIPLWQTAVYIAPEWSYFQVELANYYFSTGDKESAEKQLEFCQKFTFPKKHCSEFSSGDLEADKHEPVGFLKNKINEEIKE